MATTRPHATHAPPHAAGVTAYGLGPGLATASARPVGARLGGYFFLAAFSVTTAVVVCECP
jgi:hypothetical protein